MVSLLVLIVGCVTVGVGESQGCLSGWGLGVKGDRDGAGESQGVLWRVRRMFLQSRNLVQDIQSMGC